MEHKNKDLRILTLNYDAKNKEQLYLVEKNEILGLLTPLLPLSTNSTRYYKAECTSGELLIIKVRRDNTVTIEMEEKIAKAVMVKDEQVIIDLRDDINHFSHKLAGSITLTAIFNQYHRLILGQVKCCHETEVPLIYVIRYALKEGKETCGLHFQHDYPKNEVQWRLASLDNIYSQIEFIDNNFFVDQNGEKGIIDYAIEYEKVQEENHVQIFPKICLSNVPDAIKFKDNKLATLFLRAWAESMERCYLVDDEIGLKAIRVQGLRRNGTFDAISPNTFPNRGYSDRIIINNLKTVTFIPEVGYVCERQGTLPNTIKITILGLDFEPVYKSDEDVLEISFNQDKQSFVVKTTDSKIQPIITVEQIKKSLHNCTNSQGVLKFMTEHLVAHHSFPNHNFQNNKLLSSMGYPIPSNDEKLSNASQFVHQYPSDKSSQ